MMIQIHQTVEEKCICLNQALYSTQTSSAQVLQTLHLRAAFCAGTVQKFLPLKGINARKAGTPACSKSISRATGRKALLQILLTAMEGSHPGLWSRPCLIKKHDLLYTCFSKLSGSNVALGQSV